MKKRLVIVAVTMLLWQVVPMFSLEQVRVQAGDAQQFLFKFEPDQPLLYAIKSRISIDMDMQTPGESAKMTMEVEMRYDIKLTPKGKLGGDVTTLRLEPSGLEADWDITGPAGHIIMKLRGSDITATQNGVTIMDTKKDIGLAEAREVKNELVALYLSGDVDIDSKGKVIKIRGDVPFVEFWTEAIEGQPGFFGVVFPGKPIATGDTWKQFLTVKKMGDILLEEPGLRCMVTLTRDPDTTIDGRNISRFILAAPFKQRDLVGYTNQGGQRIRVNIPTFDRSASGAVHFDGKEGVLIDYNMEIEAKCHMNMSVGEETAVVDMVIGGIMDMQLLP